MGRPSTITSSAPAPAPAPAPASASASVTVPALARPVDTGPVQVALVGYRECCALDLVGPSDVFETAGQLTGRELYRSVVVTGDGVGPVVTESRIALQVDGAAEDLLPTVDTVLVGGGRGVFDALADRRMVGAVAGAAERAPRILSVCTGSFVLAAAGLLAGRRATTHWAYADRLAQDHPSVTVVPDELYVVDGPVVTAAGVTAGIDLALAVVAADHGEDLARAVARRMVVYLNRSGGQSQFSERLARPTGEDPGVAAVVAAVLDDPAADHTVPTMADRAGMSQRHFARRFRAATGTTPGRWVERVRVDAARTLLEQGALPPVQVADRCGFGSYHTMRQAFRRVLGVSPARYRTTH
ncbi:MAG: GlxA family transcriptional regulator [Actinomycetota bacterium]